MVEPAIYRGQIDAAPYYLSLVTLWKASAQLDLWLLSTLIEDIS